MKNQEQFKRLIRAAFCINLLIIHATLFWYVWHKFYSPLMETPYWRKGHWLVMAFYLFWVFILPKIYGGWKVGYLKIFDIFYSQCLGIFMTNSLIYFLIILLIKHFENPGPLLLMMLLQFAATVFWAIVCSGIYLKMYPARNVLLVYGERPVGSFKKKMSARTDRFEVGDIVHISEGFERIKEKCLNFQGMVICDIPSCDRNVLLKFCYGMGIRCYTIPKISDLIIRSAENQHMFDTPLLLSRNNGFTIEQRVGKRITDIVFSSTALICSLPIMVIVALLVKAEDGGGIIYRQKRLTLNRKEFYIYKFRSMREDAERDGVARLAGENDSRITKVGRVIRALRFDELPQLFNILRGEMSIVGPRPERPELVSEYEEKIPEFAYRLKVKAGLTGYAQVYGKYNTTAYDKLKLDLMYIQNYSLKLDIEIMLKTVQILFMRESTQGVAAKEDTTVSTDTIADAKQEKQSWGK